MSKDIFTGFTAQTIQFFKDLRENNNREWFEANRKVYETELLEPFRNLILHLTPTMASIDPDFDFRPNRVMSRIYRDVRFSKNKLPYNAHMWLTFQIPVASGEWQNYPGYFMQINADGYTYGMGMYGAKRAIMNDFRDNVKFRAEEFRQETQQSVLDKGFMVMGEEYKRPLQNDLSDWYQMWMQRKSVWVMKEMPITEDVYSVKFADDLAEDFQSLEWLFNFFKESQPE